MYGDHLPTMGLTVEDLKNKYLFQTEYVMWDNFGTGEKEGESLQLIRWQQRLWIAPEYMKEQSSVITRQEEIPEIIR